MFDLASLCFPNRRLSIETIFNPGVYMNLIILLLGAYIVWRIMASRSSKPGQEPSHPVQVPQEPVTPKLPTVYLDPQRVFMVERFAAIINAVADSLKMDPFIIKALIYVQSGGDDAARIMQPDSEYGYGLTQITCTRARKLATDPTLENVTLITDCLDLETPINSVYYGSLYLHALYQGDWASALARYYSPTQSLLPREDAIQKATITIAVANTWRQIK